jgi:hypothetical protein
VQKNVSRAYAGFELDLVYLETLSLDAAPALARAYVQAGASQTPGSAALAGDIAQVFTCHANRHSRYAADLPWPSFHLARAHARQAWLDHAHLLPPDLEANCPLDRWDGN